MHRRSAKSDRSVEGGALLWASAFLVSVVAACRPLSASDRSDQAGQVVLWDAAGSRATFTEIWEPRTIGTRMGGVNAVDVVSVEDGLIYIRPRFDGKVVLTGAIRTSRRIWMTFGRFDVAMKVCLMPGLRAAAWMQSDENVGGSDGVGAGAEIDLIEIVIGRSVYAAHNIHWGGYGPLHRTVGRRVRIDEPCAWHTYHVDWRPTSYQFGIDGKPTWTSQDGVSSAGQYMILSVEMPNEVSGMASRAIRRRPQSLGYVAVRSVVWTPYGSEVSGQRPH